MRKDFIVDKVVMNDEVATQADVGHGMVVAGLTFRHLVGRPGAGRT